jgi:ribosomal protein S18 acetylase RimI-like enzyme
MLHLAPVTPDDLAEILAGFDRFWDGRDLRALHHPMFARQFGDTGLVARRDGELVGYLLGFVTGRGEGYVHLVAVRDDARGTGVARTLYERFAAGGMTAVTAITSPGNTGSLAFHARLGFTATTVPDYSGPGQHRVLLRRELESPAIGPAVPDDAGELLTLQRAAYLPEVLRYGGRPIPPAVETLPQVRAAIEAGGVLVARDARRIVGSVRAVRHGTDGQIGRLVVAPDRQGQGLGTRLLRAAEAILPGATRYVLFTGHASDANLRLYTRLGYTETHRATDSAGVSLVHLARTP